MTPGVLALLAGLAGAAIGEASESTRPWIVAICAAALAFETAVMRPRLETGHGGVLAWRWLELVGVILGIKAIQILAGSAVLFDTEFWVAVIVAILLWESVNATMTDLDAIRRAVQETDGMTPLQRIRLRFIGIGCVVVAGAALGAVGMDGMLDIDRGAARVWSPAPIAYFIVGVAALGAISRTAEERRWLRDGADVDPGVVGRWIQSVLAVTGIVAVTGLAVQYWTTGVSAVPMAGLAAGGRVGDWLGARAEQFRARFGFDIGPIEEGFEPVAGSLPEFELAEPSATWLGDVALWLFIGMIFAFVIARSRHRRARARSEFEEGVGLLEALRLLWEGLWGLFVAIFDALRRVLGGSRFVGETAEGEAPGPAEGGGEWEPTDSLRRRIAAAYRAAASTLIPHHGVPRRPETVREFAGRVGDERFDTVTLVFEEARYSNHVLDVHHAERAEHASAQLTGDQPATPE